MGQDAAAQLEIDEIHRDRVHKKTSCAVFGPIHCVMLIYNPPRPALHVPVVDNTSVVVSLYAQNESVAVPLYAQTESAHEAARRHNVCGFVLLLMCVPCVFLILRALIKQNVS